MITTYKNKLVCVARDLFGNVCVYEKQPNIREAVNITDTVDEKDRAEFIKQFLELEKRTEEYYDNRH